MTYRDKLQEMIEQLHKIYDESSSLRDMSDSKSKDFLNNFRGSMAKPIGELQKLDNQLSDGIANQKY